MTLLNSLFLTEMYVYKNYDHNSVLFSDEVRSAFNKYIEETYREFDILRDIKLDQTIFVFENQNKCIVKHHKNHSLLNQDPLMFFSAHYLFGKKQKTDLGSYLDNFISFPQEIENSFLEIKPVFDKVIEGVYVFLYLNHGLKKSDIIKGYEESVFNFSEDVINIMLLSDRFNKSKILLRIEKSDFSWLKQFGFSKKQFPTRKNYTFLWEVSVEVLLKLSELREIVQLALL